MLEHSTSFKPEYMNVGWKKKRGTVDSCEETHNHVTTAIKSHICIILQHNCFA